MFAGIEGGFLMRDMSLHLLDIVQNSVKAGATSIGIEFETDIDNDILIFSVIDNGCGMEQEFLKKVMDPFTTTRTTRGVGLGISFLKESCEITGGVLKLESEVNVGTKLTAKFVLSSIDRIPIGDIGQTMFGLILDRPDIDYTLKFTNAKKSFELNLADIRITLEDVPLNDFGVCTWLKELIEEEKINIFGGTLNEIIS